MLRWVLSLAVVVMSLLGLWFLPQQLPVTFYKLSLVSTAAVVGYWIDRALFPYARGEDSWRGLRAADDPDVVMAVVVFALMLRRALIVAAAMLSVGLGA